MKKVNKWLVDNLPWLIVAFVALLCTLFIIFGKRAEDGSITLNGEPAQISEATKEWMESAEEAYNRIVNESKPTDEETIKKFANGFEIKGLGGSVTLDQVKARRLPDGDTDYGKGWQCSKYTAYLATGQREYSYAHPDYGPVNGKDMVEWLIDNFGWKRIDNPVEGAIGSGGFNTLYGHTAEFLYWIDDNTAMVSDANYIPLTVDTHAMNVDGWIWAVPGDYKPDPEPEPEPEPEPIATVCDEWPLKWGDTMGLIMQTCEGYVEWGEAMNSYARTWYDPISGLDVYSGWHSADGIGLYAGRAIIKK